MSSFAEDVSKERGYLSRAARFSFLSQTLVTYLLQAHVHMGSIDSSIDSMRKSFIILTLLSPHTSHCDEYTSLVNSSRNVEVECLLDKPSEKRAEVEKEVFIKGKQETADDVLCFISNLFVFPRFWVRMDIDDVQLYPFVLQLLVKVANILSSVEYRDFDGKFVGGHEFMAHTLIAYVFTIFSLFVKMVKTSAVTRHAKACNELKLDYLRIPVIIQKKVSFFFIPFISCLPLPLLIIVFSLLEQLQICIVTTSVCNLFAKTPVSIFTFCTKLAGRYFRFVRSDGTIGGRNAVTLFDTNGEKRKDGGGNNKKVNHLINNDSGAVVVTTVAVGVETTALIVVLPAVEITAAIEGILMVVPSLIPRVST